MEKIRWGLIGCGDIAEKRVAPAIVALDNCELLGVVRADSSRVEAFAKKFNAKKWYREWQELIKDPDIDAVYIATPVYLHAQQAVGAAEAGKHVLTEKPMAMTAAECDRIIAACKVNSVTLGVAYYRHFYPAVSRIKSIIQSGEIGLPVYALVRNHENFNPRPGDPRYWLVEEDKAGGGPMMDMGCHRIEVLMNILGEIIEVRSTLNNAAFEREVEDTAVATFTFINGASGVVVSTHAARFPMDTLEIWGCKGKIEVSSLNGGKMHIVGTSGARDEEHPPHDNVHLPLIEDFSNAVLEKREPAVGGSVGRTVNAILDEIYSR